MKKVLICGGAGFIGSNYARYYFQNHPGDRVYVLDKLTYAGNRDNLSDLEKDPRFEFIQGDITDKEFIDDLFFYEKFDIVVNFAAETHVDYSIVNPGLFVKANIVGTHNLLEAVKKYETGRYHQISTDEVYGDLGEGSTDYFVENSPLQPNCPYAASKASADLLVLSYYETYALPLTISRCSNNYGPYQYPEKLIPLFFNLAMEDKPLTLHGDGMHVRDWLYVVDHCRAVDLIVYSHDYGEIYNIGGHNEKTTLEITDIILDFLGKGKDLVRFVPDRAANDRRYAMDPSKLEKKLGWEPSVTFEEGIKMTFEWYQNNRQWLEKLLIKTHERARFHKGLYPVMALSEKLQAEQAGKAA